MSASSAPQMAELPHPPSLVQKAGKKTNRSFIASVIDMAQQKTVQNAYRWGFAVGSLVTFHCVVHSNHKYLMSIGHGVVATVFVTGIK